VGTSLSWLEWRCGIVLVNQTSKCSNGISATLQNVHCHLLFTFFFFTDLDFCEFIFHFFVISKIWRVFFFQNIGKTCQILH
jgi:hypothetical protein